MWHVAKIKMEKMFSCSFYHFVSGSNVYRNGE